MIIKLLYKQDSGEIIQALEEWDWTAKGCPEPVIDITQEQWNAAQCKKIESLMEFLFQLRNNSSSDN